MAFVCEHIWGQMFWSWWHRPMINTHSKKGTKYSPISFDKNIKSTNTVTSLMNGKSILNYFIKCYCLLAFGIVIDTNTNTNTSTKALNWDPREHFVSIANLFIYFACINTVVIRNNTVERPIDWCPKICLFHSLFHTVKRPKTIQ